MHMHSLQSIIQITEQWLRDVIHHENTLKKNQDIQMQGRGLT